MDTENITEKRLFQFVSKKQKLAKLTVTEYSALHITQLEKNRFIKRKEFPLLVVVKRITNREKPEMNLMTSFLF